MFRTLIKRTRQIFNDDTAVSIPVETALGLMILLTLSAVFLGGITTMEETREDAVAEQELERIADEVAHGLAETDTLMKHASDHEDLSGTSGVSDAAVRTKLPSDILGESYTITIEGDDDTAAVYVNQNGKTGSATVQFTEVDGVEDTGFSGGHVIITVEDNELTVRQET